MQKHQIHNCVFDSLQSSPFDGTQHLRETSDQKPERDKKFLEFNFKEGLLYAQMPNSKIFISPPLEEHVYGALLPRGDLG